MTVPFLSPRAVLLCPKRAIVVFLGCFLLVLPLKAQYNTRNEWYVGVSGGGTLSTIILYPKYVDKLYNSGRTGGLTLRYISEDHFGIQTELNYFESGWKEDLKGTGQHYSYARQLRFIDLPFLVHAYSEAGKSFRLFLNAGPKISWLLDEHEELVDSSVTFLQHGKPVDNPFQYGIMGSTGIEWHISRRLITGLEGSYTYRLSNIFSDKVGDDFSTSSLQEIAVKLYLLVRIH